MFRSFGTTPSSWPRHSPSTDGRKRPVIAAIHVAVATTLRSRPKSPWIGIPSPRAQSRYGSTMYLPAGAISAMCLLPEFAPARRLLFACFVVAAFDCEGGFFFFLLRPMTERIAPPRILQIERGQLQVAPQLDGAFHVLPLGQRQRRIGPGHRRIDKERG